jgi:hypothetical protein
MHQIYRHANQIFVDLGDPPKGVDLAVDLLLRASRAFQESRKAQIQTDGASPSSLHHSRPQVTEVSIEEALALSRFSEIPWFKRLWVVQEVCLWDVYTAFPPLFLCGDHSVQWIDLINAASQLGHAPPQIKYDPQVITPELEGALIDSKNWGPAVVAIFLEYYKIISKQGPGQDLHWFLQRAWELQSTNSADKVYGLLGLVNDRYSVIHAGKAARYPKRNGISQKLEGKREIRVDYDLPFQTVYEEVARLTIEEEDSLDSLADAGTGKSNRTPLLPSWVPDWSKYPNEPALVSMFGPAASANYRASLGLKPVTASYQIPGLLEVDAYFVDVVLIEAARYCGETDAVATLDESPLKHRVINLKQHVLSLWWCFGVKYNKYPTGQRPFDVFWRTLIANRVTVGNQKVMPEPAFAESFLMACPEILEVEVKDDKPACICPKWATVKDQQQQPLISHCPTIGELNEEDRLPIPAKYPRPGEFFGNDLPSYGEHYNSALHQAAMGRRFFTTKTGYIGMGPKNLTRQDAVVILKGGCLPFLVRKADVGDIDGKSVYTLLGEAYVHGISDGEALREDSKWTRVVLN